MIKPDPGIMCRLMSFMLLIVFTTGQSQPRNDLFTLSDDDKRDILARFRDFLAIANDGNYPKHVFNNLEWCEEIFSGLNFDVGQLATEDMPLLFAEKIVDREYPTVLFYLQIDGQPVDTSMWDQPNPYGATLKKRHLENQWETLDWEVLSKEINDDWALFARSAADSKGPAFGLITALQIMNVNDIDPEFNVKVIMDFQEELGSPALPGAVRKYADEFKADFLVIMDGVRANINEPTLTFGARGITTLTIRVFGPKTSLHSGHYGNYAPNPVFAASRLIASMKDEEGRVIIPGFYDGVEITREIKEELEQIPEEKEALLSELGISRPEQPGNTYQESMQYPSLNVRGMSAAWVGEERRTIIPSEVIIEMDMRLVVETDGERLVQLVRKHITDQGFYLVDGEPSSNERSTYSKLASLDYRIGSKPFRTDYGTDIDIWLSKSVLRATGIMPLRIRTTGGSQPISPFITQLNLPAVSVRLGNPDSSIHAPNENIRLGNFFEGIQTCLAILTERIGK